MRRLSVLLAPLACLATAASAQTPQAPRAPQPVRAADLKAFDAELARLRTEHRIPGLSAAIVQDGKVVWAKGYGEADDGVPATPDTPYWIASVTKPFVALLFLQLAADGTVNLQDRINDIPGWMPLCTWLAGSRLPFGRDLRCRTPITIDQILHHTANGTPGTRFLYNPILYSRLSRYIEWKTGHPVSDAEGRHNEMARLMEQRILGPARMRRTMASQWQREKMDVFFDMAQGFGVTTDGERIRRPRPERHLPGGAGVVSTVLDLAAFDIALDRGTFGSPELIRRLFTPARAPDGRTLPYAYGWYIQPYRGETLQWHAGWDDEAGYTALFLRVPSRRLALILLANGEGLWWDSPLDSATVERSAFARPFLERFVFTP